MPLVRGVSYVYLKKYPLHKTNVHVQDHRPHCGLRNVHIQHPRLNLHSIHIERQRLTCVLHADGCCRVEACPLRGLESPKLGQGYRRSPAGLFFYHFLYDGS